MKNQISEVIKEDLNESVRSNTGRNTPMDESFRKNGNTEAKTAQGTVDQQNTSNSNIKSPDKSGERQESINDIDIFEIEDEKLLANSFMAENDKAKQNEIE